MAEIKAANLAEGFRSYPTDDHGKLRFLYGKATNDTGAALDAGSTVVIGELPSGRVRVLPYLSRYRVSALGASRVMAIGHKAYFDRGVPETAPAEPLDADAFAGAIDVSSATNASLTDVKFDLYSRRGVELIATVTGGTIPTGATFEFAIAYLYE